MAAVLGRRSSSKLKTLPIDDRMLLQLPRLGLASEQQTEHLDKLYPEGGQRAIQALLNLMSSGVVDGVIWARESWVGDSIGSVTGFDGDKLDLMEPVAMPPTGGCNLMYTEGVLESMLNQLQTSVEKAMHTNAVSTDLIETLAVDVPRQVCLLIQRVRFTNEVQRCIRENRQLSTVTRANNEIKKRLCDTLLSKDFSENEGERATIVALSQVLHEQTQVLETLIATKSAEDLGALWNEQVRFYHDDKEKTIELKFNDKVVNIGHEYSPPSMLITTEFTHTLRWAYLEAMSEGGSRILVLIGSPGCGKTGMLINVGQMLGMLPTTIRASEKSPANEAWWRRRMMAAFQTGGGRLSPVIVTQAHRAPAGALEVALKVATDIGVALCLTMSPGAAATALDKSILAPAGATKINVPASDLKVIAAGQLAAEGLKEAEALAVPLGNLLESMAKECSAQAHYDFGPRTLMQLCTQVGQDRRKATPETDTVVSVLERCLLPKLLKDDVPLLVRLLKENFKVDKTMTCPSDKEAGRWPSVSESIKNITKLEPDCMVLPVPPADEEAFEQDFCKMLNRNGSTMVRFNGKLCDMTPEQLLGTMPKKGADAKFETVTDGEIVKTLRKAMEDNVDPNQITWIYMVTGNISMDVWESLHELLNDSRCINLATGEQLRLAPNLRFLFVMPDAGLTTQDTFSRAAVVYSDPRPEVAAA